LKRIWMNYGWFDPMGRVRRQPYWCNHFRVDGQFGSDLEESSPRWRIVGRERVVEEVDEGPRAKRKQQQQQVSIAAAGKTVDRSGRPSAVAADQSTGPVDRCAQHAQRYSGRLTAEGERSTVRSID